MAKPKLTSADNKFIAKFFNINFDATEKHTRSNFFTHETVEVDPICAACIDFVFKIQLAFDRGTDFSRIHPELKESNVRQNFDRARMIVLKLDSEAYMKILD